MAKKKQITCVFEGFEIDGVLYPPDKAPQKVLEAIEKAVREVLFPNNKESLSESENDIVIPFRD